MINKSFMMMSYNEILKIFSVGKGNFEKKNMDAQIWCVMCI